MNNYNILYDNIMSNISHVVAYEINEAYSNYLLEEYNSKELFDNIIKEASKESKIFYKHLKKFIVYIIKKLQSTDEYKKAEKIMTEYKKQIEHYILLHKQITPRRMLKITIAVLTMYGGVSMIQDCRGLIKSLQGEADRYEVTVDSLGTNTKLIEDNPEEFIVDVELELSDKNVSKDEINSKLPVEIYNTDKNYSFTSSDKSRDFIKQHEMCLLYPYYANAKEEKEGKVTIGYGHVVLESDGDIYNKIQQLKKKGLIKQSFTKDKSGQLVLNPNHCKNLITSSEADKLFLKDIKIAEDRALAAIKNMDADENVKCFMLYNQNIKDGLTSLCYNAGNLKQEKYSFITKGLSKCRYDYKNNCINSGDYNVSFQMFKNIKDNPNRRAEEYNMFFLNANKPLTV